MLLVVLATGAVLYRVPIAIVIGTLAVSFLPISLAVVVVFAASAVSVFLSRQKRADRKPGEGDLLRQFSGRVAAGATIRTTVTDAGMAAVPTRARRLAALGQPMTDVGDAMMPALPVNGAAFRAICSFSEHTGAAIAHALAVLAERADDATELARQRRVSLAQVKLSAVVVGLVPIGVSIGLLAARGIPEPGGAVIVVPMMVGIALQAVGTTVVFRVASRAN